MLAYISEKADKRILHSLAKEGFEINALPPFPALSEPVSSHADMLLLAVEKSIFKHADYQLEGDLLNIFEPISPNYPNDILLNIAVVGKHAFANTKHASETVLEYLKANGFCLHHVSQGYAHCSTCIVSDRAIITADGGIAAEAQKAGLTVLKIGEGHIALPPYDYGFIGGASGATDSTVYFCGSLKYHPDGSRIREFIEMQGKAVIELTDAPLSDVGGIIFK